jgi:hypothetical protein
MRGQQEEIGAIRQQLQVGTVLTGSVRIAGPSLRVRSQLIDTETGVYLWSETFDRQMQDVFAIQEEIARAIVRTLRVQLAGKQESALTVLGRYEEALAMLQKGRSLAGDVPSIVAALGQVHGLMGDELRARELLAELERLSETGHVPAACFRLHDLLPGCVPGRARGLLHRASENRNCTDLW